MHKVYLYTRYERFWHWMQALLIIVMMVTGFEMHGYYELLGFNAARQVHVFSAFMLIGLFLLTVFWHFATGEWKQFIPADRGYGAMVWYYIRGIFEGASPPERSTPRAKLNPLQRLSYIAFSLLIFPTLATTGLVYFFWDRWSDTNLPGTLELFALIHTFGAFLLVAFMILHVYLTTTGRTITSNIRAMITGRKLVRESDVETNISGKRVAE